MLAGTWIHLLPTNECKTQDTRCIFYLFFSLHQMNTCHLTYCSGFKKRSRVGHCLRYLSQIKFHRLIMIGNWHNYDDEPISIKKRAFKLRLSTTIFTRWYYLSELSSQMNNRIENLTALYSRLFIRRFDFSFFRGRVFLQLHIMYQSEIKTVLLFVTGRFTRIDSYFYFLRDFDFL